MAGEGRGSRLWDGALQSRGGPSERRLPGQAAKGRGAGRPPALPWNVLRSGASRTCFCCVTIPRLQRDKSGHRETVALFPRTPHVRRSPGRDDDCDYARRQHWGKLRHREGRSAGSCHRVRTSIISKGRVHKPQLRRPPRSAAGIRSARLGPVPSGALTIGQVLVAELAAHLVSGFTLLFPAGLSRVRPGCRISGSRYQTCSRGHFHPVNRVPTASHCGVCLA